MSWTDDPMRLAGNAAIVAAGLPEDAGALSVSLEVHAVRKRDAGTWRLSAELAAAIEAEVAERVAEALRSGERVSDMTVDKHLGFDGVSQLRRDTPFAVAEYRVPASAYALESGAAVQVAEALRSQLPEDAPDEPGAWQGRSGYEGDVWRNCEWDPKKRAWRGGISGDDARLLDAFTDLFRALCTEPPELTMPMRARRQWRERERQASYSPGTTAAQRLKARASELRALLIDSGEPL